MRRGFTLVELIAVVALLGLLVSATAWSLAGQARSHSLENVIGQIAHADQMARMAAQRLGLETKLVFDIDRQQLCRVEVDREGNDHDAHTIGLGGRFRLTEIRRPPIEFVDAGTKSASAWMGKDSGVTEIAYSTGGRSISYAVLVTSREGDLHQWVVMVGLTGQLIRCDDEQAVDKLFERIAKGRPDAD